MLKFESFRSSEVYRSFYLNLPAQAPTTMTLERTDIASTSGSMDLSDSRSDFTAYWYAVSILSILWSLFILRINDPCIGFGYVAVLQPGLGRFRGCVSPPEDLGIVPALSFAHWRITPRFLQDATRHTILASNDTKWPSPPRCSRTLKFSASNYRNTA